jgi:uncharacterized Rossmann fold enzyme
MSLNQILKDHEFSEKYHEIMKSLGFSLKNDVIARDYIYEKLTHRIDYSLEGELSSISKLIENYTDILIVGGGPDATSFIQMIIESTKFPHLNKKALLIVAIDGATELLAKYCIIPHIIVTDLDGLLESTANQPEYLDTYFIIHAHGDNINKIHEFESIIESNKVIGTTQTTSKIPIVNTGGFTDGDRALNFLGNFTHSITSLYLVGFDFNSTIGQFSKPNLVQHTLASEIKLKKLRFGAQLSKDFCTTTDSKVTFMENEYEFILKSELKHRKNCSFIQFHNFDEIKKYLPVNLLCPKLK